jgi:hypothetical protein
MKLALVVAMACVMVGCGPKPNPIVQVNGSNRVSQSPTMAAVTKPEVKRTMTDAEKFKLLDAESKKRHLRKKTARWCSP